MILSGILHTSLGGFTVIRGVAPLGGPGSLLALRRCQPAQLYRNPPHWRSNSSWPTDSFCSSPKWCAPASASLQLSGRRDATEWRDKGFRANSDGIALKVVKTRLPQGYNVVGGNPAPTIAYLTLTPEQLERANGHRLFRIDGNHRLSAVDGQADTHQNYRLPTPFCVVLHDDATEAKRFEKVVFHNINAKQIPLTSEENLRLILQTGDDALFTDDVLLTKPSFGPAYWLARHLLPEFRSDFLSGLSKHFENKHTLALGLAQFLMAKQAVVDSPDATMLQAELPRLRKALKAVNANYEATSGKPLRESACHGVLTAFVYFALKNDGRQLPAFTRWIESNRIDHLAPATTTRGLGYHYHLGRTQAVDAASLVEVFESVLSARSREVFVSMQFGTPAGEEPVYKAIKEAIDTVNTTHGLQADLALTPIRIDHVNKGHSYTIADEILKVVNGCGLLIADLTQGNKNVYHEVGFLMGLNQGRTAEQDNFILLADNKQIQSDAAIGFNLRHWQQVRFDDTLDLKTKLVAALEAHFRLGSAAA